MQTFTSSVPVTQELSSVSKTLTHPLLRKFGITDAVERLEDAYQEAFGKPLNLTCEWCNEQVASVEEVTDEGPNGEYMGYYVCSACYWRHWQQVDALSLV